MLPIEISEPYICSEQESRFVASYSKTPKIFVCINAYQDNKIVHGHVFFKKKKDKIFITEIKF
jgi:hypothetical protein